MKANTRRLLQNNKKSQRSETPQDRKVIVETVKTNTRRLQKVKQHEKSQSQSQDD